MRKLKIVIPLLLLALFLIVGIIFFEMKATQENFKNAKTILKILKFLFGIMFLGVNFNSSFIIIKNSSIKF